MDRESPEGKDSMTHTSALLEISPAAHAEIERLLRAAGYNHAINHDQLDMQGIALVAAAPAAGAIDAREQEDDMDESGNPEESSSLEDRLAMAFSEIGAIRRRYGEPGSRDVDVTANNKAINLARKAIYDALASRRETPAAAGAAPAVPDAKPIAWLHYAAKKPSLRRVDFHTSPGVVEKASGWKTIPLGALAATPAPETAPATAEPFQTRVRPWLMACFGEMIAGDREERNHRFIEEALELVQACGCTASEAHQLVDYVFARPVGDKAQEVGGVMVTLAALCLAQGLDMAAAGETELARIWTKVEQIRAKQAAKPKHSPLPVAPARCGYCDDTGDVHGLDGEWSGVCSCPAGDRVRAAVASPDDTPLETGEGDAR
jgi:hypothetical protein